ncbi:hypothetical protein HOD29_02645 [archaeon]|jgi:hypothetical protein|nr:hypothetical protein [archaeon]
MKKQQMITREEILRLDPCDEAKSFMNRKYPDVNELSVEDLYEIVKDKTLYRDWLIEHFPIFYEYCLKIYFEKYSKEIAGFRLGKPEEYKLGTKVMIAPWSVFYGQFKGVGEIKKIGDDNWVTVKTKTGYQNIYRIGFQSVDGGIHDLLIKIKQ